MEELRAGDEIVEQFDIDRINSTTLLFQTGYLTIVDVQQIGVRKMYTLRYPNLEEGKALKQIKEKKYHEKYMKECDEICLIGIEFGKRKETLSFLNMRK